MTFGVSLGSSETSNIRPEEKQKRKPHTPEVMSFQMINAGETPLADCAAKVLGRLHGEDLR
jgi:hypothetical protein